MAGWISLLNGLNGAALAAFGREVMYSPESGAQTAIRAVFEPAHQAEESSPGVYAVLFVKLSDLPQSPARGDEVVVDSVLYKVFDVEADTSGAAVLRLRQV
jgi:hypothetical protein